MCDGQSAETGEAINFCPLKSPIHHAAAVGDVKGLKTSLKKGEDINMLQQTVPPLYVACIMGNLGIVKTLVGFNCDINSTTLEIQQTGLHGAVSKNRADIVTYLLKHGAEINKQDVTGATSLFLASQYGHITILQNLINFGADLNIPDNKGLTPLAVATLNGCVKAADLLIRNKADLDQSDRNGNTALFHAVKSGQRQVFQMLTKAGATVNVVNFSGEYPITIAATYGNTIIIEDLINNKCDVNVVSSTGTPVFLAVQRQHLKALQKLISAGADVRKMGPKQRDPLVEAVHQNKGNAYVVKELISAGSDVDVKCDCHEVLLQATLSKWNFPVIAYMVLCDTPIGHIQKYFLDEIEECCLNIHGKLKNGNQPCSLKGICRKRIKAAIGSINYRTKAQTLFLPVSLQKYLLYDDMPSFCPT